MSGPSEDDLLRSSALQNVHSILAARQHAEDRLQATQEALRRSEAVARAIFDQAAVGIAIADLQGRFVQVNPRFCRVLGYSADELLRLGWAEITDPADLARTREHVQRLLDGAVNEYTMEKRYRAKDGAQLWSLTTVTLLRDVTGEPRHFIGAIEDITQRKQTEAALRRSEQFSRTIIESSRDCIKILALDGRLMWINDRGLDELQAGPSDQLLGRSWAELWPEGVQDAARAALAAAAEGRSGSLVACLPVNGTPRWWDVVVTPIDDGSERPERLLAVSRDVTRIMAAEQALRDAAEERRQLLESERAARSEAERLSATKDEFLAILSHELRTPLSAILGWAHVLRRGVLEPAEAAKGLETIERNARLQAQLIDDLLDMSRVVSGKLRLELQAVAPNTVIEAALDALRPTAEAKHLQLTATLDPDAGPVSGDPARLQQVVWNLLSNAIKFTPSGGSIDVALRRADSAVEIVVADTGIGIAPEFQGRVFERFSQADSSSTRKHGGLGLGLAIAKQLVELHGGSVRLHSAGVGKGTTFFVRLPLRAVARAPDARGPADVSALDWARLAGLRVLVVDDEPDARELVRRVLRDCEAEVVTAGSAAEALALVERERPQVMVSDIGMPEVDGYELLRRVRALGAERGGEVAAIALTAFARPEDRLRALRAGFRLHIAKPVDPAELIASVASVSGRTRD